MSSRKMSLSGWRPTFVSSPSRTNFEPLFGPRLTTRTPAPSASSPTSRPSSTSPISPVDSSGMNEIVVSVFGASAAPHDEQKFTPDGLRWPQLLQNTALTVAVLPFQGP